jgi:hypothetical protein
MQRSLGKLPGVNPTHRSTKPKKPTKGLKSQTKRPKKKKNLIQSTTNSQFSTTTDSTNALSTQSSISTRIEQDHDLELTKEGHSAVEQAALELQLFQIKPYREHILKVAEQTEAIHFTTLEQAVLYDEKMVLTDFHSYIDLKVHTQNISRQKRLLDEDTSAVLGGKAPLPPLTYPHLKPNAWSLPPMLIPSMTENSLREQSSLYNSITDLGDLVHKYLSKHYKGSTALPPPVLTFENTILAYETTAQRTQATLASLQTVSSLHPNNTYRNAANRSSQRFGHMARLEGNNPTMKKVLLKFASSDAAQKLGPEERALTGSIVTSVFQTMGLSEFVWDDLLVVEEAVLVEEEVEQEIEEDEINGGKKNDTGNDTNNDTNNIKTVKVKKTKLVMKKKLNQNDKPGGIRYSEMSTFIHSHMYLLDKAERHLAKFYDLSSEPAKNGPKPKFLLQNSQNNPNSTGIRLYSEDDQKSSRKIYDELELVTNSLSMQHPLHAKYNSLLQQQAAISAQLADVEKTHMHLQTMLSDLQQAETVAERQQSIALEQLKGTLGHLMAWIDGVASISQAAKGIGQDLGYFLTSTMERLENPGDLLHNTLKKFHSNHKSHSFSHHRPRPLMQVTLNELEGIPEGVIGEFLSRNARYYSSKLGDDQSILEKVIPGDDGTTHDGFSETPAIILGSSYEEYVAVMTFVQSDVVRYRYWTLYHHGGNNPYPTSMLPQLENLRQPHLGLIPQNEVSIFDNGLGQNNLQVRRQQRPIDSMRQNNEHIPFEEDLFTVMLDLVIILRSLSAATSQQIQTVKKKMNEDLSVSAPKFNPLEEEPIATGVGDENKDRSHGNDEKSKKLTKNPENLSNSDLPKKLSTYLDLIANQTLLGTPDNVRDFVDHLVEIAKDNINNTELHLQSTLTPYNIPSLIQIKQRLYLSQAFRNNRGADMVRYNSMRRQYIGSDKTEKYTTQTLGSMTTPSLTGYELNHEILRIESLLLEQLNQQALYLIGVKEMEAKEQSMAELYKDLLDMVGKKKSETKQRKVGDVCIEEVIDDGDGDGEGIDPVEKLNRKNAKKGSELIKTESNLPALPTSKFSNVVDNFTEFLDSFGAAASALMEAKSKYEETLELKKSENIRELHRFKDNIDQLRTDFENEYFTYLLHTPSSGLSEMTPDEQDEVRKTIRMQIIQRIRPTVTTLFPWEKMYFSRLADPTHSSLQGNGTLLDLEDLRENEAHIAEQLDMLEKEQRGVGTAGGFERSILDAKKSIKTAKMDQVAQQNEQSENVGEGKEKTVTKQHVYPPHHPMARMQQQKKDQTATQTPSPTPSSSSSPSSISEQNTPKKLSKLRRNGAEGPELDGSEDDDEETPLSILPPLPPSLYNVQVTDLQLQRQHHLTSFNLPYTDFELSMYLPLPFVLHNLLFIFEELFQVDITQSPTQFQLHPSDTDTIRSLPSMRSKHIHVESATNSLIHDVWHRDVMVFKVFDRNDKGKGASVTGEKPLLGTFYLDLFGRSGKEDTMETIFSQNSFRHSLFVTPDEATVSGEIFKNMNKMHSLQFFLNQVSLPFSEDIVARVEEKYLELERNHDIIQDPAHESVISSTIDSSSFSEETFKKAFNTIRSISQTHFNTTNNPTQTPLNKKSQVTSMSDTNLELTTTTRAPPVAIITLPLTESNILPPTHEIDNLVDETYQQELIKSRRTGVSPQIIDTKTLSRTKSRMATNLDHSAATVQQFKDVNGKLFNEITTNSFKTRRIRFAQLQNLPNLINKSKLPTSPMLLHFGDVKTLFHEFGHMMMQILDHTPYLHSKSILNNQEIQELISHICEQFLVHDHPNKPRISPYDQSELDRMHQETLDDTTPISMDIFRDENFVPKPTTMAEVNGRLHNIFESLPKLPSFGTVHAITQHYSYVNHGEVTHLHNMYNPDFQYLYKSYIHSLSQFVFPKNTNQRLRVRQGNSRTDFSDAVDYNVFSKSLLYLSNYHNTKNSPRWRKNLVDFDRDLSIILKSPHSSIQNEIGLGHPVQNQVSEFGITNDQKSISQIEMKLSNAGKTVGRFLHPNSVDTLIYEAIKQASIEYDENATITYAGVLPHQQIDVIPLPGKDRQKQLQKLFQRFPAKPPLSYFNNLLTRESMSVKITEHESIVEALLDHHLHQVEYLGDINDPIELQKRKRDNFDDDDDDDGDGDDDDDDSDDGDNVKMIETDTGLGRLEIEADFVDVNKKQKNKWSDALLVQENNNSEGTKNKNNTKDPFFEHPSGKNPLSNSSDTHISLNYFTEKIFNFDDFRAAYSSHKTPLQQLKERPLQSRSLILGNIAANTKEASRKTQDTILALQVEQRPKSTILLDRVRGMREKTISQQEERLLTLPVQKRPIDVSNQRMKYKYLLPQYMFLPHETARYNLNLSQAQATQSMSNNIYRTLQFLLENPPDGQNPPQNPPQNSPPPIQDSTDPNVQFCEKTPEEDLLGRKMRMLGDIYRNPDPLGVKMFPPATPTLPTIESIKPIAHNLTHFYNDSYAGMMYSYPYAEMLAHELFDTNFLAQSVVREKNIRRGHGIIQQQRKNSLRLAQDPIFGIKSDLNYELQHHRDLLKLATTSPLTPFMAVYGSDTHIDGQLHDDIPDGEVMDEDGLEQNGEIEKPAEKGDSIFGNFFGKKTEIAEKNEEKYNTKNVSTQIYSSFDRPSAALPYGYYKSSFVSKPTVAFVNQYFNIDKSNSFKHSMKLFQDHNVMAKLSQFVNIKNNKTSHEEPLDLVHFYRKNKNNQNKL